MKLALLGLALMGTGTYNMTDMFHKAQDVTGGVTAIYASAGEINHFADAQTRIEQQQKLFAVAQEIDAFANDFGKKGEDKIAMLQY